MDHGVDPVTREIVKNALAAAADEMAIALYRTAYSTIVRDCLDYSTSLCDREGQMIAQGVTIPLHLGSVPFAMETLFARYGDDMEPGDVFILNDPFEGGMHIPDIFIVKPIYWEGARIAFSVSTAHHLDLGGRLPGSSACDNTEIYQDGLRIPWLKLHRRGEPDEALLAMIRVNVRVPEMTLGDLRAQVAACHTGERAVHELVRRYGPDTFRACTADLIDYTERLVRAEIARWPDGTHTFTDYMDSDGVGGPPVKLHVALTVEGDSLTADFTGSAPQVPGAINNTYSFTFSVAALSVRAALRLDLPNTAGIFRPITVIAPEGTVLNVVMPGASSMRGITGFRLADLMFGVLAKFVPHRIQAAGEGGNSLVVLGGLHPDRSPYVYYELMTGTWGGRPDRDANDGLCNPANVASNIPVEEAESNYPLRIERYGLVRDSGGPGRFRGGLAVEREWRLLDGRAHLAIRSDRRDHLPYGLSGGRPGTGSINLLSRESGEEETLITMVSTSMEAGERLYHRQAGGGGWGDPLERDPELVAQDARNDKVSLASARDDYGVVLDPDTCAVDHDATAHARRELAAGPTKEDQRRPEPQGL
ncbi:MAG: hydantoinase B/oxoprolinase family protein [Spirochaetaceae bacterium]|nr:hydantoinase B/oxoprolinase family protein [Spirochaetaceae bacterium]